MDWKKRIPHASDPAIDLLKGLLTFSPVKRFTVEQAINHPYFANLRKLDNPPKCNEEFDWTWEQWHQEKRVKSIKEEQELIQTLIYNESLSFHPQEEPAAAPGESSPVTAVLVETSPEGKGAAASPAKDDTAAAVAAKAPPSAAGESASKGAAEVKDATSEKKIAAAATEDKNVAVSDANKTVT